VDVSRKLLFLDESGNHDLGTSDPDYPIFVLGGVIVDRDYAGGPLAESMKRFKREFFGTEEIILHTADIVRNKNGVESLIEPTRRRQFYEGLNSLMRDLEYQVVACAILKGEHVARFGADALDPYLLSLNVLVERFCFEIGDMANGGRILAERRSRVLDHDLEIAWLNLRINGTRFMSGRKIERRIDRLVLIEKHRNIAGSQLADLVVSPIGRAVLGKPTREDWEIIEQKFRRRDGRYDGPGLVVLPKK